MFLKKLFAKPYQYYKGQGDRLLEEERYADARAFYLEALERVGECFDRELEESYLRKALFRTGSSLANMNLLEAENAIRQSDLGKAHDHILLALELAEDVAIREKAEILMKKLDDPDVHSEPSSITNEMHNCTGCGHDHSQYSNKTAPEEGQLPNGEQFQLLIHTLPGNLSTRYALMGEKFAYAYMTAHHGDAGGALEQYEQLLSGSENDILLYETAITKYQLGDIEGCEKLLLRAVTLNDQNPLCNLTVAQLFSRTGRYAEALTVLQKMFANNMLQEQALMMLGEVYELQGDDESAVQIYTQGLSLATLKRAAAERLLPIFKRQGKDEEVQYLQRHYLKGCC